MTKSNSDLSDPTNGKSLRRQAFDALNKNPLLKPIDLCLLLQIDKDYYRRYMTNLRHKWKRLQQNKQARKCSSHGWRGSTSVPMDYFDEDVRSVAVRAGWKKTKSRNRWLLWKDKLGRLRWFETGTVSLWVRKPANQGKAYQLVCNAFSHTGLITDMKVLEDVLRSIHFEGAHYVFPTGARLPRVTIDLFRKSNGIVVKVGDVSDPTSVELEVHYPDWQKRNEKLLGQILGLLKGPVNGNTPSEDPYYVA